MVELQSEDEKKAKVVGKADNNKEQATKEQAESKIMILNKDEIIEKTKSEGEARGEDKQYGKPNQQEKKKKSGEMKHQQEKKIKIKIPAKQTNQKQDVSNYIKKLQWTKKQNQN